MDKAVAEIPVTTRTESPEESHQESLSLVGLFSSGRDKDVPPQSIFNEVAGSAAEQFSRDMFNLAAGKLGFPAEKLWWMLGEKQIGAAATNGGKPIPANSTMRGFQAKFLKIFQEEMSAEIVRTGLSQIRP